jgi:hypothetical protein
MRVFTLEKYDDVAESHEVLGVFLSTALARGVAEKELSVHWSHLKDSAELLWYQNATLRDYWLNEWETDLTKPVARHNFTFADGQVVVTLSPDGSRAPIPRRGPVDVSGYAVEKVGPVDIPGSFGA